MGTQNHLTHSDFPEFFKNQWTLLYRVHNITYCLCVTVFVVTPPLNVFVVNHPLTVYIWRLILTETFMLGSFTVFESLSPKDNANRLKLISNLQWDQKTCFSDKLGIEKSPDTFPGNKEG